MNAPRGAGDLKYDGSMIRGSEVINGESCTILERSYNDRYYRQTFWISQRDFLPRKLRDVIGNGSIVETWLNIKTNEPISNRIFLWNPPKGWTQLFPPNFQSSLLKSGTKMPDFNFPLLNGQHITLSQIKGNITLMCLWSLNCPPCREELPYLQKIYSAYKDKGLIILGVTKGNTKYEHAFLSKNGITFPIATATTDDDRKIIETVLNPLGMFPVNYLIDKDGKIVDSWIDYENGDDRLVKDLYKLGIK